MAGLEQAAMALPPPSAYLQGHHPAHAAAVHLAGMLPFAPHMFHQGLLSDPALHSIMMQDPASLAALQHLQAFYAGMPPQMLEALAAGAPGMHAMLAPGCAPGAMQFPSQHAFSELMRAQYGTSPAATPNPTRSRMRCTASEGSGAQVNTKRGLATGTSRLANPSAVESAASAGMNRSSIAGMAHESSHSEAAAAALERSDTAIHAASAHAQQRAEALRKVQEKKQFRSFEKKVHYESRKQLAEKRPRVQGKFTKATSAPSTTTTTAAAALANPNMGVGEPESGSPVVDDLGVLAKIAQANLVTTEGTANKGAQLAQKVGQRHVGGSEETSSGGSGGSGSGGSGSGGSGGMGQQGSSRGIHSGGSGSSPCNRGEPSPPKPSQSA